MIASIRRLAIFGSFGVAVTFPCRHRYPGVVPGVGQAMDARDPILGIITISRLPAALGGWVELVITLIGCVPAVGDALDAGFKPMKQGHNFGPV